MNEHTLIIDDDPSFNAILVRTLERRGHLACGALDTVSALQLARETQAGNTVLDLNLNRSSLLQQLMRSNSGRFNISPSPSRSKPF